MSIINEIIVNFHKWYIMFMNIFNKKWGTMPKILDQVENKILEAAKKQIFEEGIIDFSLRTIAKECDIAVSTIYNYYKNKEKLIETIILEDWFAALYKMDVGIENASLIEEGFLVICTSIRDFIAKYNKAWSQFHGSIYSIASRHQLLLDQIKVRIERILEKFEYEEDKKMSNILAECVLACSTHVEISETEYLYCIHRLFNK